MTAIVQVEYRSGLLSIREEILEFLRHPIVSVSSSRAALDLDLSHCNTGAIVIGHGAPWQERCDRSLISRRLSPAFRSWHRFASEMNPSVLRTTIAPPMIRLAG